MTVHFSSKTSGAFPLPLEAATSEHFEAAEGVGVADRTADADGLPASTCRASFSRSAPVTTASTSSHEPPAAERHPPDYRAFAPHHQ